MPRIVPVVRAETVYTPPAPQPLNAWADVPGAELVYLYMESRTGRPIERPVEDTGDTYYARINQNRWLADCDCGSAQVISPTDPRYGCVVCGWGWVTLVFPEDVAAVEAQMLLEPKPAYRNWWHPDDPRNPDRPIEPEVTP
ncbi:hypothetical protein ACWCWD_06270 [Streptomyces sp. NPDC001493]